MSCSWLSDSWDAKSTTQTINVSWNFALWNIVIVNILLASNSQSKNLRHYESLTKFTLPRGSIQLHETKHGFHQHKYIYSNLNALLLLSNPYIFYGSTGRRSDGVINSSSSLMTWPQPPWCLIQSSPPVSPIALPWLPPLYPAHSKAIWAPTDNH
jgi:hypothetical protein